jgi:aminoglycoside phosphotransferase (APT) family kinase protein
MLHHNEADTSPNVADALIRAQMPELAGIPLRRITRSGTENALYKLGEDLLLRLPLTPDSAANVKREALWLEKLSGALGLRIPDVVAIGEPDDTYPFRWLVQRWLPGADALQAPPMQLSEAADALVALIRALRAFPELPERGRRGGPIAVRDGEFRRSLAQCAGLIDVDRAGAVWEEGLAAGEWYGSPVLLHADLIPSNLLVTDGRLSAVIDFASTTSGDPAYDLIPAWFVLDRAGRARFLDGIGADEAMIRRARALVVSQSVIALPYYLHSNEIMVETARKGLASVLSDQGA